MQPTTITPGYEGSASADGSASICLRKPVILHWLPGFGNCEWCLQTTGALCFGKLTVLPGVFMCKKWQVNSDVIE
jgi:hypothetical protein